MRTETIDYIQQAEEAEEKKAAMIIDAMVLMREKMDEEKHAFGVREIFDQLNYVHEKIYLEELEKTSERNYGLKALMYIATFAQNDFDEEKMEVFLKTFRDTTFDDAGKYCMGYLLYGRQKEEVRKERKKKEMYPKHPH